MGDRAAGPGSVIELRFNKKPPDTGECPGAGVCDTSEGNAGAPPGPVVEYGNPD